MNIGDREELVRRLGVILDELPVSRRAIARAAGLSHGTVNRIVRGDPTISYRSAAAIGEALARWSELFGDVASEVQSLLDEWKT